LASLDRGELKAEEKDFLASKEALGLTGGDLAALVNIRDYELQVGKQRTVTTLPDGEWQGLYDDKRAHVDGVRVTARGEIQYYPSDHGACHTDRFLTESDPLVRDRLLSKQTWALRTVFPRPLALRTPAEKKIAKRAREKAKKQQEARQQT
jgi:hypothetical protein